MLRRRSSSPLMFAWSARSVVAGPAVAVGVSLLLTAGCSSDDSGGNAGSGANGGSAGTGATAGSGGTAGSAGAAGGGSGGSAGTPDTSDLGGERPVTPFVPESYDPNAATPLVIMLHGFGASGLIQESVIFQLKQHAEERTFIYLFPDGTVGEDGRRFWNATPWCCDFGMTGVDDVGYIAGLIAEAKARYNIDDKRVYVMGHSNGGFMSHRFACEHAGLVAGIASLAGATYDDPADCTPSEPVNVLQMHGTMDDTVSYTTEGTLPGAEKTVSNWAGLNGCTGTLAEVGEPIDYVNGENGVETQRLSYSGCPSGGEVELWRMTDVGHVPGFNPDYRRDLVDWLLAHPKP